MTGRPSRATSSPPRSERTSATVPHRLRRLCASAPLRLAASWPARLVPPAPPRRAAAAPRRAPPLTRRAWSQPRRAAWSRSGRLPSVDWPRAQRNGAARPASYIRPGGTRGPGPAPGRRATGGLPDAIHDRPGSRHRPGRAGRPRTSGGRGGGGATTMSARLLFVEDDATLRELLTHTFRRAGYQVTRRPPGARRSSCWPPAPPTGPASTCRGAAGGHASHSGQSRGRRRPSGSPTAPLAGAPPPSRVSASGPSLPPGRGPGRGWAQRTHGEEPRGHGGARSVTMRTRTSRRRGAAAGGVAALGLALAAALGQAPAQAAPRRCPPGRRRR